MDAKLRRNLPRVLGVAIALVTLMALGAPQAFASEVVIPPGDEQPPVEPPPPEPPPPPPPEPVVPPSSPAPIVVSPTVGTETPKRVGYQTICLEREYVRDRPRGVPIATVRRKDRVRMGRRAHGGRWSYVITRRSRGWIRTRALCG